MTQISRTGRPIVPPKSYDNAFVDDGTVGGLFEDAQRDAGDDCDDDEYIQDNLDEEYIVRLSRTISNSGKQRGGRRSAGNGLTKRPGKTAARDSPAASPSILMQDPASSAFPSKAHDLICALPAEVGGWTTAGEEFSIVNADLFQSTYLPLFFR